MNPLIGLIVPLVAFVIAVSVLIVWGFWEKKKWKK